MKKKITSPRRRSIPNRIYREADQLAALMADERTPDETRTAIINMMLELSISTGVHVYTARIVREAFLCMIDACHKAQEEVRPHELESMARRDEISRDLNRLQELLYCVGAIDADGQHIAIDLTLWRARQADLDAPHCLVAEEEKDAPAAPVSQSGVVDLLCWKQSRPRAIVRPLFSFPESEAR
jgi:hypothetical protein